MHFIWLLEPRRMECHLKIRDADESQKAYQALKKCIEADPESF